MFSGQHKAGRQAFLLFSSVLGGGMSASELFGSFEDLRHCSRTPELHKDWRTQILFWIYFFLMWPNATWICFLQFCQQVLLVLSAPFPAVSILHRSPCAQVLDFHQLLCSAALVYQGVGKPPTIPIKAAHFTYKTTNKDHSSKWGEKLSLASEVCELNWIFSANCSCGSPFNLHKFSLFFPLMHSNYFAHFQPFGKLKSFFSSLFF